MATTTGDRYVFSGDLGAARAFAGRTVQGDLAFLLPHLRPGMSVLDCGCGAGSLTVGLAQVVAPGQVVGFDVSEAVIEEARALLARRGLANVRFEVANVYESPMPDGSVDVAVFCGVLSHLSEPAAALQEAYRVLKPGGTVAAREPQKDGDWFGGPCHEAVELCNRLTIEDWRAGGGDPMLGRRLKGLLVEAGFVDVEAVAEYSPALSASPQVPAGFVMRALQKPDYRARAVKRGNVTPERLERLLDEVRIWMDSPHSLVAIAECMAIGQKPEEVA